MSKNKLLNKAESIIKKISKNTSIKQRPKVAHIAYELYVYSLVLEALNSQSNGKLTFKNIKNQSFRPRYAPGKLNPSKHSYVKYDYSGESFEVHLDTQYEGLSKVSHEIDISIINTDITPNFLHAAIECKYTMIEMDFHYTREFMGMLSDFPQTRNIANDRLRIRADYIVTSASKSLETTVHKKTINFLASKSRKYRPHRLKYSKFQNNLFLQNSEESDFKDNIMTMNFK